MRVIRSIGGRLLASALLGSSIVLVASCVLIYVLVKESALHQLDDALVGKARTVAALCELEGGAIHFEPAAAQLPEYGPSGRELFEIWTPDGKVVAKSASLGSIDLPAAGPRRGGGDAPSAERRRKRHGWWLDLPGDRRARVVRVFVHAEGAADARPEVVVAMGREAGDVIHVLGRLRVVLLGVWLASEAVLALVLVWSTRRGLAPLRKLAEAAGATDERTLARPFAADVPTPTEIAPVVKALDDMLARLGAAFARERTLVSNVAHELRTPLAGLRTTLDVALLQPELEDAARQDFARCLAIVVEMQGMVDNLLALARFESGQTAVERRPFALDDLARECWAPFAARAAERELAVARRLEDASALGDAEKLRIVLRNLFANAVEHCDARGSIEIETGAAGRRTTLRVANSGCAIAPEEAALVFDRFWRGDAARSGGGAHCGLGLSLSREIVQRVGGSIEARVEQGGRFVVELSLPAVADDENADGAAPSAPNPVNAAAADRAEER